MRVASLFAGIGGFDLAATRLGMSVVYANEWDSYAADVYDTHFEPLDRRDIREVASDDIPDFDILLGGPPCQSFSLAGKQRGLDDERGSLVTEYVRILADKRPRYFLFENVKQLLGHDKGKTFPTLLELFSDVGYECQWQILDSKDFGVPQHRERLFIVGHSRSVARPKVFPLSRKAEESPRQFVATEAPTLRTLTAGGNSGGDHSGMTMLFVGSLGEKVLDYEGSGSYRIQDRVYDARGISPTLNTYSRSLVFVGCLGRVWTNKQGKETCPQEQRVYNAEGIAPTLDTHGDIHLLDDCFQLRRLTPLESERAMGFPDNWTEHGLNGKVSMTRRYKMIGNAVTPPVIESILARLQT
jgi:DNA (cytosine-5)-methyltransferase 1